MDGGGYQYALGYVPKQESHPMVVSHWVGVKYEMTALRDEMLDRYPEATYVVLRRYVGTPEIVDG